MLAVVRGYGGQATGDLPVNVLCEELASALPVHAHPADAVMAALASASTRLRTPPPPYDASARHASVTAVALDGSRATVIHVGACRAYLLRDTRLRALTDDHVFAQLADRFPHPILRRALSPEGCDPDVIEQTVTRGDCFIVLCETAVRAVAGAELVALVRNHSPQDAADAVVARARQHVAHQNATAVIGVVDQELERL